MRIKGIDHIQLAMPRGREDEARAFYEGVLGIPEAQKPTNLAKRGGCWFIREDLRVHLGVDDDFRPARKAHPAFLVEDLSGLRRLLAASGVMAKIDEPLEGYDRIYVDDPFGNRIELLEPVSKLTHVAVGTTIADRPSHRSVQARLRIRLLRRMSAVEACVGIGVQNSGWRNPSVQGWGKTFPTHLCALTTWLYRG